MSTATSVGRSIDSRPTIDWQLADYRSTVGRLSIDYLSTGDREVVDCRPIVDRLSIDRVINHWPSIGRYFDRISVMCRWYIGQLSVAYQSCVNLAGESSGFPFERLSDVIMLLGKMLQSEARLL